MPSYPAAGAGQAGRLHATSGGPRGARSRPDGRKDTSLAMPVTDAFRLDGKVVIVIGSAASAFCEALEA